MPRVTSAVARKDYPNEGIKKGDTYYSWSFYRQKPRRSKTYPRPSQLCNNKLSGAYAAQEALEDAIGDAKCPEDITSAIEQAVSDLQSVVDEFQESIDNLEQAFQNGCPALDEHNDQKDGIEAYISDLESASSDISNLDVDEYIDDEKAYEKKPESFDDLNSTDQGTMLDAAKDLAMVELSV